MDCPRCGQPLSNPVAHEFCQQPVLPIHFKDEEPDPKPNLFSTKYQVPSKGAKPHYNGKTEKLVLKQKPLNPKYFAAPGSKPPGRTGSHEPDGDLGSYQEFGRNLMEDLE